MPEYVVLFPSDDEGEWAASSDAERQATFDVDSEFGRLLEAHGGAVSGGAGLAPSSAARTIRSGPGDGALVTHGPSSTSGGQLSGFFIVTCDDYDALTEAAKVLTRAHPVVEIRPVEEL